MPLSDAQASQKGGAVKESGAGSALWYSVGYFVSFFAVSVVLYCISDYDTKRLPAIGR